jgi:thioredoxin-like negative regulator of GroEL
MFCQQMNPIVDGLGIKYAGRVKIVWQDVDDPATQEMALKYKVRSVPTFVLLDGSDQVVGHWLGLQPPEVFEEAFATLLEQ